MLADLRGVLRRFWKSCVENWKRRPWPKRAAQILLLLAMVVLAVVYHSFFWVTKESHDGFVAANWSNSITADAPLVMTFRPSHSYVGGLRFSFVAGSAAAADTGLQLCITDAADVPVYQTTLSAAELYRAKEDFRLPLALKLAKGETYRLYLSCDAVQEDACYRVTIGTAERTDVTAWYSGTQPQPQLPEVVFIYPRAVSFGYLAVYLACLFAALAALVLPAPKKTGRILLCTILALIAAAVLLLYTAEMLDLCSIAALRPTVLLFNLLLLFSLLFLLYALSGRLWVSFAFGGGGVLVLAVVNYFVLIFRGVPFAPSDFFGAETAAGVLSAYQMTFAPGLLVACAVFGALLCTALWAPRCPLRLRHRLLLAMLGVALAGGMAKFVAAPAWQQPFGIWRDNFRRRNHYVQNGFLLGFSMELPYLFVLPPAGYDADSIGQLAPPSQAPAADAVQRYPDIIMIMNESWADLSIVGELPILEDVLPYTHSLAQDVSGAAYVGRLVVPVYGAGTSTTEFEALTGFSMAFANASGAPYSQFVHGEIPALPGYLRQLGYATLGMHPHQARNWERGRAYPLLGFDEAHFLEDGFANAHPVRAAHVTSDTDAYATMLELAARRSAPRFIFQVTMQNHGGYLDDVYTTPVQLQGAMAGYTETANYLSLLRTTDDALQQLLQTLEAQADRPTLFIMFGDHWGSVNEEFITWLFGKSVDDLTLEEDLLRYQTPVVIWNNYGADLSALPAVMSANYLPLVVKQLAQLPLTGYDQVLAQLWQQYPVLSVNGLMDAAGGVWASPQDAPSGQDLLAVCRQLQYNGLHDDRGRVWPVFLANVEEE